MIIVYYYHCYHHHEYIILQFYSQTCASCVLATIISFQVKILHKFSLSRPLISSLSSSNHYHHVFYHRHPPPPSYHHHHRFFAITIIFIHILNVLLIYQSINIMIIFIIGVHINLSTSSRSPSLPSSSSIYQHYLDSYSASAQAVRDANLGNDHHHHKQSFLSSSLISPQLPC